MALGKGSKYLQEFGVEIGVEVKDKDSVKQVNLIVDQLKEVFKNKLGDNELFNYKQEWKNVQKLTSLIDELGSGMRATFLGSGSNLLSTFSLNFENLHKGITTVLIDFKEMIRLKDAANAGGEFIKSGTPEVNTTVVDKTNPKYQMSEVIKLYTELRNKAEQFAKQSVGSEKWQEAEVQLSNAQTRLDEYIQKHEKLIDDEKLRSTILKNQIMLSEKLNMLEANKLDKEESTEAKDNLSLYNQTLGILNTIHTTKIKLVTADEKSSLLLKEQLKTLQQELSSNVGSGRLTTSQVSNVNSGTENNDKIEASYAGIVQKQEQSLKLAKEQSAAEDGLKSSLNYQVTLKEKINSENAKNNTEVASAYNNLLAKEEIVSQTYKSQILDKQKIVSLENDYSDKMSIVDAKEKSLQRKNTEEIDTDNIKTAIKAYDDLIEAKIRLTKLQQQKANDVVIESNVQSVKKLQSAYTTASSAVLKDNSVVASNEKVKESVIEADKKLLEAQNNISDGLKNSTVHVSSFNSKMTDMIRNVFQYRIASSAFQEVDQAIMASIKKVKALDDSMTQIRLVTGGTSQEAQQMIGTYANLALQLHTTTQAVADGSVEWLFNRGHYKFL